MSVVLNSLARFLEKVPITFSRPWLGPYPIDSVGGAYPATVELKDGSLLVVYYEEGSGSAVRIRLQECGLKSLEWD